MESSKVVIIGAGLSGLCTAYLLEKKGISSTVIEARNRLGGRICTYRKEGRAPIEMGATWFGKKHQHLIKLLNELDIGTTEQYMGDQAYYEPISTSPPQLVSLPKNEDPTYRIEHGTDQLIERLAERLNSNIIVGQPVISLNKKDDLIKIKTPEKEYPADIVITTLPPKLLVETVSFEPSLPQSLVETARKTQTWMAESIKVGLTYERAFWKAPNCSGTITSNVGPVNEMYDHSNADNSLFALKGFMNDAYHVVTRQEREQLVVKQLKKFFGEKAGNYSSYHEKVWRHESFTYSPYEDFIIPHQHNGHPIFDQSYWNQRLFIGGSETASAFPGYMDGAIESAKNAAGKAITSLSTQ
ncbi:MAG TPA: NAD(P)/FAD-dependent oxidoreductase [Balneolaceae bacterium]|nr:NAD(P)/FAD-dependent oxidoreductase [Balneolaceae bacterium]